MGGKDLPPYIGLLHAQFSCANQVSQDLWSLPRLQQTETPKKEKKKKRDKTATKAEAAAKDDKIKAEAKAKATAAMADDQKQVLTAEKAVQAANAGEKQKSKTATTQPASSKPASKTSALLREGK